MKSYILFMLLGFVSASCCKSSRNLISTHANKNTYESVDDTLFLPFDTLRVLNMYDIPLSGDMIAALGNEKIDGLNEKWDTLELSWHSFACDCPNWFDEAHAPENPPNEMEPPYRYYVEPASPKLKLYENFYPIDCNIRFIGKKYKHPGIPKNTEFTDPGPPVGNVFRYYKYVVMLPVTVLGPKYHTGEREIPSDPEEMITTTVLTIPKNRKKK